MFMLQYITGWLDRMHKGEWIRGHNGLKMLQFNLPSIPFPFPASCPGTQYSYLIHKGLLNAKCSNLYFFSILVYIRTFLMRTLLLREILDLIWIFLWLRSQEATSGVSQLSQVLYSSSDETPTRVVVILAERAVRSVENWPSILLLSLPLW